MFRLDKSTFRKGKISEQDNYVHFWLNKTPLERLEAGWYLTCSAYGIDYKDPPKMEKTQFTKRKRS